MTERERFLYSDTLNLIRARLQQQAQDILRSYRVFRDPPPAFEVLIFRGGRRLLGFYQPQPHRICIREALVYGNHEAILGHVLRHELAHLAAYQHDGELRHGPAFRRWCSRLEIPGAAGCRLEGVLDNDTAAALLENDTARELQPAARRLAARVRKLLALGSSPNQHEAELATAKANQLLQQYNLNLLGNQDPEELRLHAVEVWAGKRLGSEVKTISGLLGEFFFVFPLIEPGEGSRRLLLYGEEANIEIAEYVFEYLLRVFQELRREHGVGRAHGGGEVAFYAGLGEGLSRKLRTAQASDLAATSAAPGAPPGGGAPSATPGAPPAQRGNADTAAALMSVRHRTEELTSRLVFAGELRIQRGRGSRYSKNDIFSAGLKAGARISIHPGLKGKLGQSRLLEG
ncbi:MAG: SprT-like domain-containing protein [Spirochaetia bacterium]